MRAAGSGAHGARARGLIVVLWRAGLRISEALDLAECDLEPGGGALVARHGKGGKRREIGMDEWGWEQLRPWLEHRTSLPIGALFA
jgi:site-specific recombinase XerD